MNTNVIDFIRHLSDENLVGAKESFTTAIAEKMREAIEAKRVEVRDEISNAISKEG